MSFEMPFLGDAKKVTVGPDTVSVGVYRGEEFHCTCDVCPDPTQPVTVALLVVEGGTAKINFCCEHCWPITQERLDAAFEVVYRW